jgi:hypothetical protein
MQFALATSKLVDFDASTPRAIEKTSEKRLFKRFYITKRACSAVNIVR